MKTQKTHRFLLNKQGEIEWLTRPPVPFTVIPKRKVRFSEIVPTNIALFIAFRIIRFLCGEDGVMAIWTRQWVCNWKLIVLIGPHRGVTMLDDNRQALVDFEHELFCQPKFKL